MRTNEELFQFFSGRLDELMNYAQFFKYFLANPFPATFTEEILGMSCYTGLTRFAMIDRDEPDFVLKFPLQSCHDPYCQKEVSIYEDAAVVGLEKYFTRPVFLGFYERTINFYDLDSIDSRVNYQDDWDYPIDIGEFEAIADELEGSELEEYRIRIPLYAYEKADPDGFDNFYLPENDNDEEVGSYLDEVISKTCSPLANNDDAIARMVIYHYGDDIYEKLSTFLEEEEVNDLHTSNCSFTEEQGLKIVDYAGYGML